MPTLGELAVRFGLELRGDPTLEVNAVATLQDARPGTLSFLANPKYRKFLATTGATAVVVDARSAANAPFVPFRSLLRNFGSSSHGDASCSHYHRHYCWIPG